MSSQVTTEIEVHNRNDGQLGWLTTKLYEENVYRNCLGAEMFLVDGPAGSRRFSRIASLDVVAGAIREDFAVIVDDAERIGELDL